MYSHLTSEIASTPCIVIGCCLALEVCLQFACIWTPVFVNWISIITNFIRSNVKVSTYSYTVTTNRAIPWDTKNAWSKRTWAAEAISVSTRDNITDVSCCIPDVASLAKSASASCCIASTTKGKCDGANNTTTVAQVVSTLAS